jgi:hypothetical protein
MLDADLSELYGVKTKVLLQSVERNLDRFPADFVFQLTKEESDALRSQIVTSKGRGGRRYPPYAFTEQGVAMLSSFLRASARFRSILRSCGPLRAYAACWLLTKLWRGNSTPWKRSMMPNSGLSLTRSANS